MCRVEIGTVALDKTSCQLPDRWIAVEIFLRRKKRNMRLLNATGDKERFLSVCLVRQPLCDLPSVFSVLVLFVRESASAVTWWCLRVELGCRLLLDHRATGACCVDLGRAAAHILRPALSG